MMEANEWRLPGTPAFVVEAPHMHLAVIRSVTTGAHTWVNVIVDDPSKPDGFRHRSVTGKSVQPLKAQDWAGSLPVLRRLAQHADLELQVDCAAMEEVEIEVLTAGGHRVQTSASRLSTVAELRRIVEAALSAGFKADCPEHHLVLGAAKLENLSEQPLRDVREASVTLTLIRSMPVQRVALPVTHPELWLSLVDEVGCRCVLTVDGRLEKAHLDSLAEVLAERSNGIVGLRLGPCALPEEVQRLAEVLPEGLEELALLGPMTFDDYHAAQWLLEAAPPKLRELEVFAGPIGGHLVLPLAAAVTRLEAPQRIGAYLNLRPDDVDLRNELYAAVPHGCELLFQPRFFAAAL